jgi:hypothetical protein
MRAAPGWAISSGAPALAAHAILGVLVTLSAVVALAQAIRARRGLLVAACSLGLVCLLGAAVSGASFTRDNASGSSMAMAVITGAAMILYIIAYTDITSQLKTR